MNRVWRFSRRAALVLLLLFISVTGHREAHAAQLRLMWMDTSNDEDGFKIERRAEGAEQFELIATQKANVTSYTDSDVTAGITYCYRVRAFNATGVSAYSQEVCGTARAEKSSSQTLGSTSPADDTPDRSRPADPLDPRERPGRKRTVEGWIQELQPRR